MNALFSRDSLKSIRAQSIPRFLRYSLDGRKLKGVVGVGQTPGSAKSLKHVENPSYDALSDPRRQRQPRAANLIKYFENVLADPAADVNQELRSCKNTYDTVEDMRNETTSQRNGLAHCCGARGA